MRLLSKPQEAAAQTKYGVLYHDGGSGFFRTHDNVVSSSPDAAWLLVNKASGWGWQPPILVNVTFVDATSYHGNQPDGVLVPPRKMPPMLSRFGRTCAKT